MRKIALVTVLVRSHMKGTYVYATFHSLPHTTHITRTKIIADLGRFGDTRYFCVILKHSLVFVCVVLCPSGTKSLRKRGWEKKEKDDVFSKLWTQKRSKEKISHYMCVFNVTSSFFRRFSPSIRFVFEKGDKMCHGRRHHICGAWRTVQCCGCRRRRRGSFPRASSSSTHRRHRRNMSYPCTAARCAACAAMGMGFSTWRWNIVTRIHVHCRAEHVREFHRLCA